MSALLTVDDLLALSHAEPDVTLAYGDDPAQFGRLYLPERVGPNPVVVLLHGGCWRERVSLDYFGQAARALSEDGVTVWSLEYRRIGNGGGWPHTFLDAARGTDFLRTIVDEYTLDLERLVTVGHSAGGHLALWLAARHRLEPGDELYSADPLPVGAVVSLAGIPDLAEAFRQNVCKEAPEALMGGVPDEVAGRYRQGSPSDLLPLGAQQHLIQGAQDEIVPLNYVKLYEATAKVAGDEVTLSTLENTGHYELVMPDTPQWQTVRRAVLELCHLS